MLTTKDRPPAIRTLRGCVIGVLREAGAIHECEEHGWRSARPVGRGQGAAVSAVGRHSAASPAARRKTRHWLR
jgi:hypothetical protein